MPILNLAKVPPARFSYMYVTSRAVSLVQGYRINFAFPPPEEITQKNFVLGSSPTGIAHAVLPNGRKVVYVTEDKFNSITRLTVSLASGALETSQNPVSTGTNPRRIAVHPSNRFLYVTNHGSKDVSAYSIDPLGDPVPIPPPIPAGKSPVDIAVNTELAYVVNSGSNDISEYRIGGSGMLEEISPHSPVKAGNHPNRVAIHPNGRHVYVTNLNDNNVSQYTVTDAAHAGMTPFGALVPMQPATVPTAINGSPVALVVHPSGRFAYVANLDDDSVTIYDIDQKTGALKKFQDWSLISQTAVRPTDLAFDHDGESLYILCAGNPAQIERHAVDQDGSWLDTTDVLTPFNQPFLLTIVP